MHRVFERAPRGVRRRRELRRLREAVAGVASALRETREAHGEPWEEAGEPWEEAGEPGHCVECAVVDGGENVWLRGVGIKSSVCAYLAHKRHSELLRADPGASRGGNGFDITDQGATFLQFLESQRHTTHYTT